MSNFRRTWFSLILAIMSVGLCELAARGDAVDCTEEIPGPNSCEDCRWWLAVPSFWPHRCQMAPSTFCSDPVPNSTKSCEDTRVNCPGPADIFAEDDSDCLDMPVDRQEVCPAWRKYDKANEGPAMSGCD